MTLLESDNTGLEVYREEDRIVVELQELESGDRLLHGSGSSLGEALVDLGKICVAQGIDLE